MWRRPAEAMDLNSIRTNGAWRPIDLFDRRLLEELQAGVGRGRRIGWRLCLSKTALKTRTTHAFSAD
jgi:hypothetical protein